MPPIARATTFRRAQPKRRVSLCSHRGCQGQLAGRCENCGAPLCVEHQLPSADGRHVVCAGCSEPKGAA